MKDKIKQPPAIRNGKQHVTIWLYPEFVKILETLGKNKTEVIINALLAQHPELRPVYTEKLLSTIQKNNYIEWRD